MRRIGLRLLVGGLAMYVGLRAANGGHQAQSAVREQLYIIAFREGVDPRLVEAVAEVESGLNPGAVSAKGAQGVMQLMPDTARSLGVRDPADVTENVTAGVRYLRHLWLRFGDLRLALAAYNAGPGAVERYGGIPPYMETREYVAAVINRYYGVRQAKVSRPKMGRPRFIAARTCAGSEIAWDERGRLYVRAVAPSPECGGMRLR